VRLALAALSLALAALPFFLVDLPPCVDLPQQLAQIRLFLETVGNPDSPYVVQWLTPYSLSYLPLLGLYQLLPPLVAGRMHLMLLALLGTAAVHLVAARRGRPPEAATLASVLIFAHPLYWGFLSFLFGIPVLLGWLLLVAREPRGPAREAALFLGGALVLYFSHALWLGAALLWLGVRTVAQKRIVWSRWLAIVPVLVLAVLEAPRFRDTRFEMAPEWLDWPWNRVRYFVLAALGGLDNPVEIVLVVAMVVWIVVGVATRWREVDRELAGAGATLLAMFLVFPDRYMNTIYFAFRWLGVALILLVLATAPPLRAAIRRGAAIALAAGFFLVTATSFRAHRDELTGFREALAAAPDNPRLLGLDLFRGSALFIPRIGMQHLAYVQVLRGGTLSFSFAEHPASLVHWKRTYDPPWTGSLEWYPNRLRPRDLSFFTHVLVRGTDEQHALFASVAEPVTTSGLWRLYRVKGKTAP
jgi:hypothetical protein